MPLLRPRAIDFYPNIVGLKDERLEILRGQHLAEDYPTSKKEIKTPGFTTPVDYHWHSLVIRYGTREPETYQYNPPLHSSLCFLFVGGSQDLHLLLHSGATPGSLRELSGTPGIEPGSESAT